MEQKGSFEGRFLSKLSKIDKQEIEGFLTHLVREKHFLETVFNALVDGLLVLRPDLTVIYVNDVAIDLLGINPRRRIVGERVGPLVPIPQFTELLARFAIKREKISAAEIESRGAPLRPLQITVIPLEADTDTPPQAGSAVVLVHDATESRRASEERRRAERADTLAVLTAGLAHEIKNPLNSLQIHAQLLQRGLRESCEMTGVESPSSSTDGPPTSRSSADLKRTPGPAAAKLRKPRRSALARAFQRTSDVDFGRLCQSSNIIVEEIQRLSSVVNEFLMATRPTRPLFQRANVNRLVEHVAATLGPDAEARGVNLRVTLDHDIPNVDIDPNQITQAVLNLAKNALEALAPAEAELPPRTLAQSGLASSSLYSPSVSTPAPDVIPPPRTPVMELRTELVSGAYLIRVTDNGPGIASADLKKIFEPYFTTKVKGTGLGLAIVSRIVEDHGGSMELSSEPGRGTIITMAFPLEYVPVRMLV